MLSCKIAPLVCCAKYLLFHSMHHYSIWGENDRKAAHNNLLVNKLVAGLIINKNNLGVIMIIILMISIRLLPQKLQKG